MSPAPYARTSPGRPQVVFACVRNGGHSVIARVLSEHYAGGRVTALSVLHDG
jgi:ArsR family transcriptional regulator